MRTCLLLLAPSLFLAGCEAGSVEVKDPSGPIGEDDTGDTDTTGVADGAISVTPGELVLETIFIGQTASGAIDVSNIGEGAVDVSVSIVGGWAPSYTLDAYTSSPGAGETATHTLTLTPTTWGDHSVSLIIEDAISGGRVEVPVEARVQEDADGDGYGSVESGGDDCDEADATIHPDAEDAWYDGIDSDCAENDDYDQDGDGQQGLAFGGTDCDDTVGTTYAGAVDTWYDGVDSDCGGEDDYDQDADGYVPDEYIGLPTAGVAGTGTLAGGDCADTDATINPGATETWYDGVDTDCAGNDDNDQDGDGYALADDCDDTVATTNPGATEVWYDDVDADCAGDSDWDQDGDGVDYPTDCNDLDATTTGPTDEVLDGYDNDCDGTIDDFSIDDLASGVLYGSASGGYLGNHGLVALSDDLTGDGLVDLVLGANEASNGYAYVVDGATAAAASGVVTSYDTATITGDSGYYPIGWVNGPFGDVDNDGDDDLLVGGIYSTTSSSYAYGRSYLLDGGSSLTGSIDSDSYAARFSGDSDQDGTYQSASADLDGDGYADVIVGSAYDNYGSSYYSSDTDAGSVAVFSGDAIGNDSYDLEDATDRVYGSDDYDYLGYSLTTGDIDGDGYADVLASSPGYDNTSSGGGGLFVLPGAATIAWDTRDEDAAMAQFDGDSYGLALGEDTLPHPGDVDGDGNLDIGVTSEDSGDAWIFLGTGGFSGTYDLGDADSNFSGTGGDLGSMMVMDSDLDNDGADDIVLGADGNDTGASNAGAVFIFTGGGWGSSVSTTDANVTIYGTAREGYFGSGGAGGYDLDGDGTEDVVLGEVTSDVGASDAGAAWIVLGW